MTRIEWTDRTWNPVTGCTKVSEGCRHCYAEVMAKRTFGRLYPDVAVKPWPPSSTPPPFRTRIFTDVQCHPDRLDAPLRWRKPAMVFVNSMSDLFHEDVSDAFIDQVFAVMHLARRAGHVFQVLTKRPERMRAYLSDRTRHIAIDGALLRACNDSGLSGPCLTQPPVPGGVEGWPLPNVWLGTSIEDQPTADARIPDLLATPAVVRFVSYEPALAKVDLRPFLPDPSDGTAHAAGMDLPPIDWVIVGGESGPKARPCDVAWIRSVVQRCQAAGVPVFVKQLGANVRDRNDAGFTGDFDGSGTAWPEQHEMDGRVESDLDGTRDGYQGAPVRIHCRDRKGGDPSEWPANLRVREWPEGRL